MAAAEPREKCCTESRPVPVWQRRLQESKSQLLHLRLRHEIECKTQQVRSRRMKSNQDSQVFLLCTCKDQCHRSSTQASQGDLHKVKEEEGKSRVLSQSNSM